MAKILWLIHGYPPQQNAGAEFMAWEINNYLESIGHSIKVSSINNTEVSYWASWADVIFTHLDQSQLVTNRYCNEKPVFNVIHHNWEIPHMRKGGDNIYTVYNSNWVKKDRAYPGESVVVQPPVNPERFEDVQYNANGYVTLVNCNKDKGALIFQQIARMCPDLKFLAVKGAHGQQLALRGKNLNQWECQNDISKVLEQTSILLVPSVYESYGRIAVEAMACGIPVIAADTPGLKESIGYGPQGKFVRREDISQWLKAIRTTKMQENEHGKLRALVLWERSKVQLNELNNLIIKSIKH